MPKRPNNYMALFHRIVNRLRSFWSLFRLSGEVSAAMFMEHQSQDVNLRMQYSNDVWLRPTTCSRGKKGTLLTRIMWCLSWVSWRQRTPSRVYWSQYLIACMYKSAVLLSIIAYWSLSPPQWKQSVILTKARCSSTVSFSLRSRSSNLWKWTLFWRSAK